MSERRSADPTEFGLFLIDRMVKHKPPLNRTELATLVGVSQSTVTRWINDPGKPDTEKLALLAEALDLDYGEVLVRAGHGRPAEAESTRSEPDDPQLRELARMLDAKSPLTDAEKDRLRTGVDITMDGFRAKMLGRRAS